MEGFSMATTCGYVSYAPRIAILVGLIAVFRSLLDALRETRRDAGHTDFDVWVRRVYFVLFVGLAAAGGDLCDAARLATEFEMSIGATAAGAAESMAAFFILLICAVIIVTASLFAAWLGRRRGCSAKRATYLRRPMMYVIGLALLASLAAASCIFVSASITGFASTAAIAGGSRIAGVTAIGCLVIVVFLIVHALRARSKRGNVAPSGAVENTLFMKMMAVQGAACVLLAIYVHRTMMDLDAMARTGIP